MVGTLGQALLKAFAVDFDELFDEETGKVRIPSCIELLQRRVRPLEWEEARCQGRRKRKAHEKNYRKAIETYKGTFKLILNKRKWLLKRIRGLERKVEQLDKALKENPTDTKLMNDYAYCLDRLYVVRKRYEKVRNEIRKFCKFLKEFKKLHPIAFGLWEDVGQTKGKPPRRIAQPEEYEVDGFAIHYLNEI